MSFLAAAAEVKKKMGQEMDGPVGTTTGAVLETLVAGTVGKEHKLFQYLMWRIQNPVQT